MVTEVSHRQLQFELPHFFIFEWSYPPPWTLITPMPIFFSNCQIENASDALLIELLGFLRYQTNHRDTFFVCGRIIPVKLAYFCKHQLQETPKQKYFYK